MPQTRFCSKCGASLADGADHCPLCRTPVAVGVAGAAGTHGHASPIGNPWITMWLHPRVTIRAILNHDATYLVLPLAAVGGVSQALNRLAQRNAGDTLSFPVILLIACTLGPLAGIVGLFVGSALVRVTGGWIGGTASAEEIRASFAWGSIPTLWGVVLWIPVLALTGSALFASEIPETFGKSMALGAASLMIVQLVTAVWGFITALHCLGEVQGFSAWRALGNVILAGAIVVVPVVLVAGLIVGLAVVLR